MNKRSAIETLVSNMQSEMSRVGGKLTGLNTTQIWVEERNNTIDGDYTPHKEGTITMASNTAKNVVVEENNETKLPPAGGVSEQEIAHQVFSFMSQINAQQQVRTWKEKALDQAIPAATTVASVMVAYGLIALVNRQVAKHQAKKQLAAAKAESLLPSGEQNVA